MRKIILYSIVILALLQSCENNSRGIVLQGDVENSNQEFVLLAYQPKLRGNLNFDGFRSVGSRINEQGKFKLSSENITHSAEYYLKVRNRVISFVLFEGDNINLKFDLNNMGSAIFAHGNGAGKMNVLWLDQFNNEDLIFNENLSFSECEILVDSLANLQGSILDFIYFKRIDKLELSGIENKSIIQEIINETPLSKEEYDFIKKEISLKKLIYLGNFPIFKSGMNQSDSSLLDLASDYFNGFNINEYKKINSLNSYVFENCLDIILQIEYAKSALGEDKIISMKDFRDMEYSNEFEAWSESYVKSNFISDVYNMKLASDLMWDLTFGINDTTFNQSLNNLPKGKYLNRIKEFKELLDSNVQIDNKEMKLDKTKLDSLINSNKEKDLLFVIWSAQYSGAKVIPELPILKAIEIENKINLRVVNICTDHEKYKNLWSARIIDSSWEGEHYFLSIEESQYLLEKFSIENTLNFCNGGVSYSLVKKDGSLYNNFDLKNLKYAN